MLLVFLRTLFSLEISTIFQSSRFFSDIFNHFFMSPRLALTVIHRQNAETMKVSNSPFFSISVIIFIRK